ncbi:MAG: hypothetical protein KDK66_08215 [Deltaproteobacteria bacterium]|nr:hypothetical protein [Deltaproteobacteria bacterium]
MNDDDFQMPLDAESKGQSKLVDPTPQRKKYVTDLLFRFFSNQISYAQLAGLNQKELFQLAETGHIKLKHGRIDEAKQIFEALVKLDHKNPFYHACLGGTYQKMQQYVKAVYEYSETLNLKKNDLPSRVNRGEIYLKHKNFKKAAEDFRAAILADPAGKDIYANRARSLVIAIKRNLQKARPPKKPLASG